MAAALRTVLILGASGFIGGAITRAAAKAGWKVRAGARDSASGARRAPQHEWVRAEFSGLTAEAAWLPLLEGVDAVVNCVGVLQEGLGESGSIAHEEGPRALFAACEAAGVRRLVHISAVGADEAAGTAYARGKLAAEQALARSSLDWVLLRPSLVVARTVYGGTAMIRGLAAFPGMIPVVGGNQVVRPVAADDLARLTVEMLEPEAPAQVRLDVGGPQALTLREMLVAYRAWLGLPSAPVVSVPRWAARPLLLFGDLVAWLGWSSSMRSTSLKQLDHDVAGHSDDLAYAGLRAFDQVLADEPATVQDRWYARLYFVRPAAVLTLGLYWLLSGLVGLGPGLEAGTRLLEQAGFGGWSRAAVIAGACMDVALGCTLFLRGWTRTVALLMAAATVGYLVVATIGLPRLWLDPLGPWLKVFPMMALCLFVAATDDRR